MTTSWRPWKPGSVPGPADEQPGGTAPAALERLLFQAWCLWLCRPDLGPGADRRARDQFHQIAQRFEQELQHRPGPWLDGEAPEQCPGTVDLVFVPYVERMNASLAYYKGYDLRREHPAINAWFQALEQQETYRGTQSDFHTHAHDLPPQMGGCWSNDSAAAQSVERLINTGTGLGDQEASWGDADPELHCRVALQRVLRHRHRLLALNPLGSEGFDQPLRCALTRLVASGQPRPGWAAPWGCVTCATGFPFRGICRYRQDACCARPWRPPPPWMGRNNRNVYRCGIVSIRTQHPLPCRHSESSLH